MVIFLLSILSDDNTDIFTASLLISYYSFSPLILSLAVMISFHILSKRLLLKRRQLSDAGLLSFIKNEYVLTAHFL